MKKIIIFLLLIVIAKGCSSGNIETISKRIEISLDNCQIVSEKDTHSGFLGDGDYFAKITCSIPISLSSNWKILPLTDSINQIMSMKQCSDGGCKDVYEKYNIPKLEKGFYFFVDRHSEAKDKYDDSKLNNRSSYNFTLAIYDSSSNTIYYYKLDT